MSRDREIILDDETSAVLDAIAAAPDDPQAAFDAANLTRQEIEAGLQFLPPAQAAMVAEYLAALDNTQSMSPTVSTAGTLRDGFVYALRDLYDSEKQLTKALGKFAKAASSGELIAAFASHLEKTHGQIERLEQVFEMLGERVRGKHSEGIAGIIDEGKSVMEEDFDHATMDACLIAAGQRAEHYQIAAYGTLIAWSRALGLPEAAELLEETLEEEKAADTTLSKLADSGIIDAAAEMWQDPPDDSEEAEVSTKAKRAGQAAAAKKSARR
jgi:ferritin-like metal-binding protein YciE